MCRLTDYWIDSVRDFYRILMFMFRKFNQCMEDNVTAMFALIYYVSNGTTSTSHYVNTGSRRDGKHNTNELSRDGVVPSPSE